MKITILCQIYFKIQQLSLTKDLLLSYKISYLIAKSGKPHSIAENLLIPAIHEVLSLMTTLNPSGIISSIPLSNDTVSRQIDEMAKDIEGQLCQHLQATEFTLQLVESTVCDNEAILLAFVGYIKDDKLFKEMPFARSLTTDTKGVTIFDIVKTFLMRKIYP